MGDSQDPSRIPIRALKHVASDGFASLDGAAWRNLCGGTWAETMYAAAGIRPRRDRRWASRCASIVRMWHDKEEGPGKHLLKLVNPV